MAEDRLFDELLVIRCQGGDQQAMSLLIKRWNRKMLGKAYLLTNNYEACDDIVQECWYSIIKGINNLKDPKFFGVWVYRIVQGKSVDWIRDQQKQRKTKKAGEEVEQHVAPEKVLEKSDQEEAVSVLRKALQKLDPDQRFILSLHYLENHPVKEIGDILKIPHGTVKSRLFHARKNLLKAYKQIKH